MTLEYEGMFFVGWLIKLLIFQKISQYKLSLKVFIGLPLIFTLIEYYRYNVVFWGEIFFLPLLLLFVKRKTDWNWTQYFFYSFFTFAIDDIFMRLSSIYFMFVTRMTVDEYLSYSWTNWVPTILTFPFFYAFFKLTRFDLSSLVNGFKNNRLQRVIVNFNFSLVIYSILNYSLLGLGTLEHEGWFVTDLDDIYYQRLVLFIFLPILLGFLFYINFVVREDKNKEIQKIKDQQILDMSTYSSHIESLYKEIRSFRHDYSNLMISLHEGIKSKDLDAISKVYDSVFSGTTAQFQNSRYDIANLSNLSNSAIKSIVSVKMIEAQNRGVNLSVEISEIIDIPNTIELIDLLKILSIFLDNAIEAAVEADDPYISFVYFQDEHQKIMIVENSTKNKKIDTKSIFEYGKSTKGLTRGIGLSNVRDILSKNPKIHLSTYSRNYLFSQEIRFEE